MVPVETDETNHVKVLIVLLKSTLKPRNLSRLPCGISNLIQDLIPLRAVLLDVLIMVGHIEVAVELVLWMGVIDIPPLSIDPFIKTADDANNESCREAATC